MPLPLYPFFPSVTLSLPSASHVPQEEAEFRGGERKSLSFRPPKCSPRKPAGLHNKHLISFGKQQGGLYNVKSGDGD